MAELGAREGGQHGHSPQGRGGADRDRNRLAGLRHQCGRGEWRQIVPALHPGMRIHADVWAGVPRLWFGPINCGAALGSSPLGSSPPHQISLAFYARGEGRLPHLQSRLG